MAAVRKAVLGVDTSLRSTGVGLVVAIGSKLTAVEYKNLKMNSSLRVSECLKRIEDGIDDILDRQKPSAVAIEGIFYAKNVKTAISLGQARGVVIATAAAKGVPVYEYAPRKVKRAVVGFGNASKMQVGMMVQKLLSLDSKPQEDAADALALAICHLHASAGTGIELLESI